MTDPTGAAKPDAPLSATDDRAVRCAAELFMDQGLNTVKMTDIAEASDVGVATLYRHFSTKVGIALAAATFLWEGFNAQLQDMVESDGFLAMDGATRLEALLREYARAYDERRSFVTFLDELDHLVLTEGVDSELLAAYGSKVDSFYFIFEDAYLMGIVDGSVRRQVDFPVFYRSVAHALMSVAGKLMRGEVIPSDDFSNGRGSAELNALVDMAVSSLRLEASEKA